MTMKTTFDLPETLVSDVKRIAKARGTTAKELVREALLRVVEEDEAREPFVLHDFSQPGWNPSLSGTSLNQLILSTYESTPDGDN